MHLVAPLTDTLDRMPDGTLLVVESPITGDVYRGIRADGQWHFPTAPPTAQWIVRSVDPPREEGPRPC